MSHFEQPVSHENKVKNQVVHRLASHVEQNNFKYSPDTLANAKVEITNEHVLLAIEQIVHQQGGFLGNLEQTYKACLTHELTTKAKICENDSECVTRILGEERDRLQTLGLDIDMKDIEAQVWAAAFTD